MAKGAARGWRHEPWRWLATWFGAGLLPKAPGSWGSLAALPPAWLIQTGLGAASLAAAAILAFAAGLWATARCLRATEESDPGEIVIDEVAGQWLALLAVPPTLAGYALAFLLFRLFDIVKPWPIRLVERRLRGAAGVMLDDILAALCALVAIALIRSFVPLAG